MSAGRTVKLDNLSVGGADFVASSVKCSWHLRLKERLVMGGRGLERQLGAGWGWVGFGLEEGGGRGRKEGIGGQE